jgi:hypothetical protein
MDWHNLAQDRNMRRVSVNAVMSIRVVRNPANLFTSRRCVNLDEHYPVMMLLSANSSLIHTYSINYCIYCLMMALRKGRNT